ncbi:hypothetical protein B0A55_00145 [Friedmanniomyces simplex]|uniref:Ribosome recycling factor domain-containing protein n=1 Tax=Friedmanniomyces simplex TaxID=329884 RepID=A0A4U0Y0J5_9PEZI|nr:hypothetical protein B0A55_00145 [Friedmanniomyces simplex]
MTRLFTTTPHLHKKGAKAARDAAQTSSSTTSTPTPSDDPSDFTALETEITTALDRLKTDLSKLRTGGRFNPEILENIRVKPHKTTPTTTVKLSDIAQIIPKGRTVQVLVGEQEHVKPANSAIQTSTLLNPPLTPQPDPTGLNPLLLILNIPPPTAETRRAAIAEATKAGEKAGTAIREARARQQKKIRGMQVSKAARPDDLKKAGVGMEKVVERGTGEVRKVVEGVRKGLEAG